MKKNSLILVAVLFLSFTVISDNPVDRLGVKGPLQFDKYKYELVWSDKPNDQCLIQEYLPKGETLNVLTRCSRFIYLLSG